MISASGALQRLKAGNRRFVAEERDENKATSAQRRAELIACQEPCAIILGCSDSRVPVEMVFDQGLGDLFVIRVAGNIATATQMGSVEFAAQSLGTRLVVVLGHSECGAIQATLEDWAQPAEESTASSIGAVVDSVRPGLETLLAGAAGETPESLLGRAIRANISTSTHHLRHGSKTLERLIEEDGLLVIGA
ncbi:MAG: carbonic anhydrase, partial [Myxococcota bacterium]